MSGCHWTAELSLFAHRRSVAKVLRVWKQLEQIWVSAFKLGIWLVPGEEILRLRGARQIPNQTKKLFTGLAKLGVSILARTLRRQLARTYCNT